MVRAMEEEREIVKGGGSDEGGRETRSLILENKAKDDRVTSRSQPSNSVHDLEQSERPIIGNALNRMETIKSRLAKDGSSTNPVAKGRQQHSGKPNNA